MCGVIGLVFERRRDDLGRVAAELLQMLEYRGYDSTGAAIQDLEPKIELRKDVGAPSIMVKKLGIVDLPGQIMAGQVRWATFGAVDKKNSQPHEVRCKTFIYGAHNGNVTNSDDQKLWLLSQGHDVVSDNDGEMVVHTVEHYFAEKLTPGQTNEERRKAMREAIVTAASKLKGSFAAVIVDPVSRASWAIKAGSSLYFGFGQTEPGGRFTLASSDLSSVLKMTRMIVPISEGDFVEHDGVGFSVYALRDKGSLKAGDKVEKTPKKSRLRAKDTALAPQFSTYMEQEIHAQVKTVRDVVYAFSGGSEAVKTFTPALDATTTQELANRAESFVDALDAEQQATFARIVDSSLVVRVLGTLNAEARAKLLSLPLEEALSSSEASHFRDFAAHISERDRLALLLLDAAMAKEELEEVNEAANAFAAWVDEALTKGRRVYIVSCGSSFHAAKAGSVFFDEIAKAEIFPILPGEFRGQYADTLTDGDVVVAVTQSGETKDLVDVMTQIAASGKKVIRVGLVNNVSSTLGQELSDLVIPLHCGPEIAVPATKSFLNQMAVLYGLALRVAKERAKDPSLPAATRDAIASGLAERQARFAALPSLIETTLASTKATVEKVADRLYLAPSMHILGTRITAVAKEGALKIREVVLNHTEGFEASEFKHGPNTILGRSTLYGPAQVRALLNALAETMTAEKKSPEELAKWVRSCASGLFDPNNTSMAQETRSHVFDSLDADYPLVYVTPPNARDIDLTISQINTHKIRGSQTIVIAEEDAGLKQAATKAPTDNPHYYSELILLPKTGDILSVAFSATVVLQLLALSMSTKKAAYLDAIGVREHGVHPDVPKNVSKSITVD